MIDTRFTASNGWYFHEEVLYEPDGSRFGPTWPRWSLASIEYGAHKAQAERDAELGRWRSVEHADFVAYDHGDGRVRFMRELDGISYSFTRDSTIFRHPAGCAEFPFLVVAREYFAAHPEPKPWEYASPGELWSLMTPDGDGVYLTIVADDYGMEFVGLKDRFSVDHTGITAGRPIWKPKATS